MRKRRFLSYFKILALLVVFFTFFLAAKNVLAQSQASTTTAVTAVGKNPVKTTTSTPPQYNLNTNPDVPQNLNTYTQSVFLEILSTGMCFIAGTNPVAPNSKCLGFDQKTGKIGYVENSGGLVMAMGGLIAGTLDLPISTAGYGHYLASNFGIAGNTYAQAQGGLNSGQTGDNAAGQGVGFVGLHSILNIWVLFRNLAYLAFVLVFILLGLGIMFRINLDARTVMTIQNQLPKVIIALILITLSYAIAGFLIDMMYVTTYLVINLFKSQGLDAMTNINTNPISAVGYFGSGIAGIAGDPAKSISTMIASLFDGNIGKIVTAIAGALIGAFVGNALPIPGSQFVSGAVAGIGGIAGGILGYAFSSKIIQITSLMIVYIIIVIAILTALFRTWKMLLMSYIYIIIGVVFAPLWILSGLLPLGDGGFGPWIRSLIANLAVFPVVVLFFMIGKTIIGQVSSDPNTYNFSPPMIGNIGGDGVSAITSLIGLGLILIMPEAVSVTKSALKAPDFKLSSAAVAPLGAATGFGTGNVRALGRGLFGKNPYTGELKWGTRFFGEKGGRGLAWLTGAGRSAGDFGLRGGIRAGSDTAARDRERTRRRETAPAVPTTDGRDEANIDNAGTTQQTQGDGGTENNGTDNGNGGQQTT